MSSDIFLHCSNRLKKNSATYVAAVTYSAYITRVSRLCKFWNIDVHNMGTSPRISPRKDRNSPPFSSTPCEAGKALLLSERSGDRGEWEKGVSFEGDVCTCHVTKRRGSNQALRGDHRASWHRICNYANKRRAERRANGCREKKDEQKCTQWIREVVTRV